MSYKILDTDNCIATVTNGGKGMITNMSCLDTVEPGDMVTVSIEYLNNSNIAESFALLFCASTEPHTTCDISEYVSNAFVLNAGESGISYRQFIMPEKSVSYIAELQKWNITQNKWITDDSKSCIVNIPREEQDRSTLLLIGGLGLLGLILMKRKEH